MNEFFSSDLNDFPIRKRPRWKRVLRLPILAFLHWKISRFRHPIVAIQLALITVGKIH